MTKEQLQQALAQQREAKRVPAVYAWSAQQALLKDWQRRLGLPETG